MASGRSDSGIFILLGALVVVLGGLLFLKVHSGGSAPVIPAPKEEAAGLSNALDINVYLDGSGSIKHFLQNAPAKGDDGPPQANYFKALLDKAEVTLHNAPSSGHWSDVRLRFWKFGNGQSTPIPPNGGLERMSTDLSAFSESNTLIETPIEASANNDSRGDSGDVRPELKIIITDLYQSNGELEKPADALTDKYLRGATEAVGVLAVRNSFNGDVEDLPGTPRGKTLPHAADSMPFYIIAAGPAADARHALDALVKGTGLQAAFSKGLASEFFFTRAPRASQESQVKFSDARYSVVTANYKNRHIPLVGLSSGKLKVRWSDGPGMGDALPADTPLDDGQSLEFAAAQVGPAGTLTSDPEATQAAARCEGGELLCATFDRAKLTKGKTYVFQMDRVATQPADTLAPDSPVLRRWNIELPEAERISKTPGGQFPTLPGLRGHAGRTPDLSKFLMALQGQMFHDKVRVTSYYVYVQAN